MEFMTAFWLSLSGPQILYEDVSRAQLPWQDLGGLSMDAAAADFDGDGDLDLLIANEHLPNIYLVNDGTGRFSNQSQRIPQVARDSEDIGVADFNSDGHLDAIVVSEDDEINELYLNRGDGSFADAGERLPVTGVSNAILVMDVDGDGDQDVIIGNNGQNVLLLNDGRANFSDATAQWLPVREDVTQGLAAGDLDGDGYPDLVLANEDDNRILRHSGAAAFVDVGPGTLPLCTTAEETREVALGDVDGDGDLDILFANVQAFVTEAERQNRLLLNDGSGVFSDASARLPADQDRSFTGALHDVDRDGDLDIVTGNVNGPRFDGDTPFRVYLNDGKGLFTPGTGDVFPASASGRGFDIEFADFDGDGRVDVFLANRGTADILLRFRPKGVD